MLYLHLLVVALAALAIQIDAHAVQKSKVRAPHDKYASAALASRPAMAWNTWNKFACNVSEALIKSTADQLLALQLDKLGYTYVNLDDCWQSRSRDALGQLQADPSRFPSGLASLADYLHDRGLRFGIYSSAGFFTCAANASFPASLGLETTDATSFSEWGMDYLKYDNCMEDKGRPTVRYPPMAKALQETQRDVYYSLCEWGRENPAAWAASIGASSWRVSNDISDNWKSIITRANINAPLWRYAGNAYLGGWNDPDMLEVGNGGCSAEEYRSHFSLWAAMKSPLILGMDLNTVTLDSEMYSIISNEAVIAVNQDSTGYQARRVWSDSGRPRGRVIATKCTSNVTPWPLQDAFEDQMWNLRADGRIESESTGQCLQEVAEADMQMTGDSAADLALLASIEEGEVDMDLQVGAVGVDADRRNALGTAIRTTDCQDATQFGFFEGIGGSLISQSSGMCVEVSTENQFPLWQGKRLQTNKCDKVERDGLATATHGRDTQQHQSWVLQRRTAANVGQLKNLYQRQCLTVDRDFPQGRTLELWQSPLSDGVGGYVLLLLNLSERTQKRITITPQMMQLPAETDISGWTALDLWTKAQMQVGADGSILVDSVAPHGVVMLRVHPMSQ